MFHTEHSRVILTSHSTLASLRRDTGECHADLHPRPPVDLLLPDLIVVPAPTSLDSPPVHHWQRSRLTDATGICAGSRMPSRMRSIRLHADTKEAQKCHAD